MRRSGCVTGRIIASRTTGARRVQRARPGGSHDYDPRRAWDAIYSKSDAIPDTPYAQAQACVEVLRDLAAGGAALELAVGHGRIALPLAATGVAVNGIDMSPKAIDLLRAHPGGTAVNGSVTDISDFALDRKYALVYLVFTGFMNLTTQDDQVSCFENVARHLRPGGRFVIENVVPAIRRLPPGSPAVAIGVTEDYIGIDDFIDRTHLQLQISRSRHFWRQPNGAFCDRSQFREFTAPFRYVWPAESDVMARIAGMTLYQRWAGWDRSPLTGECETHVSVWRTA